MDAGLERKSYWKLTTNCAIIPAMPHAKSLAFAQLIRLPNIFTAVADPLAGWLIAGGHRGGQLALAVSASACLYTAGMVFNDCVDYRADCQARPERPLPRGAIPVGTAWVVGAILFLAGLVCGGWGALPLAALIVFYNLVAKKFAALGPATLGACRACNLALGLGGFVPFWPPLFLGVYVAGLSFVARREEVRPELRRWVKHLLLGIIAVDAGWVLALTGDWGNAALVFGLLVPAIGLASRIQMT